MIKTVICWTLGILLAFMLIAFDVYRANEEHKAEGIIVQAIEPYAKRIESLESVTTNIQEAANIQAKEIEILRTQMRP